jgi:DNA-binding Xre family transcriptional regulator
MGVVEIICEYCGCFESPFDLSLHDCSSPISPTRIKKYDENGRRIDPDGNLLTLKTPLSVYLPPQKKAMFLFFDSINDKTKFFDDGYGIYTANFKWYSRKTMIYRISFDAIATFHELPIKEIRSDKEITKKEFLEKLQMIYNKLHKIEEDISDLRARFLEVLCESEQK